MKPVRNLSIGRKLTLVMLLTCAAVLLLATGGFVAYDISRFRQELVERTESLANVTGHNTAAALTFNDPASAADTLAGLRDEPHIAAAYIYDHRGNVFASYVRTTAAAVAPPALQAEPVHQFIGGNLVLFRPIVHQDEPLGTIAVVSDLSGLSERLARYAVIIALVLTGSLLFALGLSAYFQRLLTRPLLQLAGLAHSVAVDRNYANRAVKESDDEIGQLVDGFNDMLAQIQARDAGLHEAQLLLEQRVKDRTAALINAQEEAARVHRQLLDTSRKAGMAEVATGVLHNVGNVLNSVNVSTQLLREKLQHSQLSLLVRTARLIAEQKEDFAQFVANDPKGRLVPGFIVTLSDALQEEHATLARETELLAGNIEHIKQIVSAQQSFARISGVVESVASEALFGEALAIARASLLEHDVDIAQDYAAAPTIEVDRQRALQILVNFVTNAVIAVRGNAPGQRRIFLCIAPLPDGVAFSVIDNGVGIAPENLNRIFTHGFTTRRDGHGFGLHSGAIAARALGGHVRVTSAGVGHGATFTLELPLTAGTALAEPS